MDYALADTYKHLRAQALQLTAAQAGIADLTFGVLMETGYPEAVVREGGLHIHFPDRGKSVPGRYGQNFLFCTFRKANMPPTQSHKRALSSVAAWVAKRTLKKVQNSDPCHMEVATDGVRKASLSHAFDSPSPGEGRSPNGSASRRTCANRRCAGA